MVNACCHGVVYVMHVLVEWLLLKPYCVEMLLVIHGTSVFSSVFAITREVRWVCMMCPCSCLCLVLDVVHVGEICESKWSYVLEVPDVDFSSVYDLRHFRILVLKHPNS